MLELATQREVLSESENASRLCLERERLSIAAGTRLMATDAYSREPALLFTLGQAHRTYYYFSKYYRTHHFVVAVCVLSIHTCVAFRGSELLGTCHGALVRHRYELLLHTCIVEDKTDVLC